MRGPIGASSGYLAVDDFTCTETVIAAGVFVEEVTIGRDGLGLFACSRDGLGVAYCSNSPCISAKFTALEGGPHLSSDYFSLTIGEDGLGLVSCYDKIDDGSLNVAHLPVTH